MSEEEFKPRYYYRMDMGIIKCTTEKQVMTAVQGPNDLFESEDETMLDFYKNSRDRAEMHKGTAESKLERASNVLNELDKEFEYLRLKYPENFL
jgi:hypothetical protein